MITTLRSTLRLRVVSRHRIVTALTALAMMVWLPEAGAQLYKKTAPPGSTFARILNGTATAGLTGKIGERTQPALPPYAASGYVFMPPGPQSVQIGGSKENYSFDADHYYTVAQTADGLKLFDLHGFESQLKAMVIVFNLLPGTALSLKTADGKTAVFDKVDAYKAAQREINPLSVSLALFNGDQKIADVPPVTFARGKASSLIVSGTPSVPVVSWDEQ